MLRRITADRHPDENEAVSPTPPQLSEGEASVPAPPSATAEPDNGEKKRHGLAEFLRAALDRQTAQIKTLLAGMSDRPQDAESCLRIVAECQKEAAAFGNRVLERHALHPAVETVDFLTSLIRQLHEQAAALAAGQTHCPLFQPLLDAVAEAAKMAQAKCEYLDLEAISPAPLDDLDPAKHEVRQAIPTDDPDQHRKIERTLIPGLIYRRTVLRQAHVAVFRCVEKP